MSEAGTLGPRRACPQCRATLDLGDGSAVPAEGPLDLGLPQRRSVLGRDDIRCRLCGWVGPTDATLVAGGGPVGAGRLDRTSGGSNRWRLRRLVQSRSGAVQLEFDDLPTTLVPLAARAIREAEALERRVDDLAGLALVADGLLGLLRSAGWPSASEEPARRLHRRVRGAADRAEEVRGACVRAIERMLELLDHLEAGQLEEEVAYDDALTARLHLPIAGSVVDDASDEAPVALRSLARLALGAAGLALPAAVDLDGAAAGRPGNEDGRDGVERPVDPAALDLLRAARGALRLPVPGLARPTLALETVQPWSADDDTLRLEVAGLLAQVLLERRTFCIFEHEGTANRYVQAVSFDRGLRLESVGDRHLGRSERLSPPEQQRLDELGWCPPGTRPELAGSNWSVTWPGPVPLGEATELVVRTLVDVHGLEDAGDLGVVSDATADPFLDVDWRTVRRATGPEFLACMRVP